MKTHRLYFMAAVDGICASLYVQRKEGTGEKIQRVWWFERKGWEITKSIINWVEQVIVLWTERNRLEIIMSMEICEKKVREHKEFYELKRTGDRIMNWEEQVGEKRVYDLKKIRENKYYELRGTGAIYKNIVFCTERNRWENTKSIVIWEKRVREGQRVLWTESNRWEKRKLWYEM